MQGNEKYSGSADPSVTVPQGQPATNDSPDDATLGQTAGDLEITKNRSLAETGLPRVPGYEVVRKLGEGTYGEVWLAEQERTSIRVAVKLFAHGTSQQWQLLQAEVKQLALLHADPGIIQLEDVNPTASPPYYVMAFAEGGSLAGRLEKGPLPLREAVRLVRQVAEALAYVHAKGVRHCDLKPANVLLDVRGRALLADFGQAHLSCDASPALGTFFYMAPEQADLKQQIPDTRWDVYGIGALLYALLLGRPPREDSTLRTELEGTAELPHRLQRYRDAVGRLPLSRAHRQVKGMDRALAEILERCLDVNPDQRYRDAGAVLEALDRRARQLQRRPLLIFGAAVTALVVFLMFGSSFSHFAEARNQLRQQVFDRCQKLDESTANNVARLIQDRLQKHLRFVEEKARDPRLGQALQAGRSEELRQLLEEFYLDKEKDHGEATGGDLHHLWIADGRGTILGVTPTPKQRPATNRFDYRDWYNGQGDQSQDDAHFYRPVERSYISQPFYANELTSALIALSTPVRDPDSAVVLGILAGSIELKVVREWFAPLQMGQTFPVVLDHRGYYLLHRLENSERILPPRYPQKPKGVPLAEEPYHRLLVDRKTDTDFDYHDPLDGQSYVATYRPLEDLRIGWGILIQREKASVDEEVHAPIKQFGSFMLRVGLIAVVSLGILIPALWVWLLWMPRRKEEVIHG
jgi:serine/threonine protein kinase